MSKSAILFDIGGSKMRLAFSKDGISFEQPEIIETPQDYNVGVAKFVETAKKVAGNEKIDMVVGGIAGPFDEKKRSLVGSPNLQGWIGRPLKADIERELGVNIYIENDAAMVGLGETVFGAGRGNRIVAYITVSTGVGGARLVDGKVDEKLIGFEPGHQLLNIEKNETLQQLIGGRELENRLGKKPREITDPSFWDDYAKKLAFGLCNVCIFWSPDCIVLGGSMITGDPAISVDKTREYLKETLKIFPEIPILKKSELNDVGGLYGALAFMRNITQ